MSSRLRTQRLVRGFSHRRVAEDLDIHWTTLQKWELGKSVPDPRYLQALCDYYETTPEALGFAVETVEQVVRA